MKKGGDLRFSIIRFIPETPPQSGGECLLRRVEHALVPVRIFPEGGGNDRTKKAQKLCSCAYKRRLITR